MISRLRNRVNINNSILIFGFLIVFTMYGCSSGSTGPDAGNGGDNGTDTTPTEPTFTNVQQIFNDSCGGSNCHIGEQESGVRLDGYDNVINSVGAQYGQKVVLPGDAAGSPLVDKIEANPQIGSRMPLSGSNLSDDEITLIRQWIDAGAENN